MTFTRNSAGTYRNEAGVLRTATVNEPRFDHDPVTGESLGLLVEEQRSNISRWSEDFRDTANAGSTRDWSCNALTVTANNTVAPDATSTADLVAGTTGTANKFLSANIGATTTGAYTYSVYLKQGTEQYVVVRLTDGSNNGVRGRFDLSNGSVVVTNDGTATGQAASAVSAGNGWYRCVITCTLASLPNSIVQTQIWINNFTSTSLATNFYAWGNQVELGSFPTSYIPTNGSAATRSADVVSLSGANFSSWYRQDEGTVFCDVAISRNGGRIFMFDDGVSNDRWEIRHNTTYSLSSWKNGVQDVNIATGNFGDPSSNICVAGANKSSEAAIIANRESIATDTLSQMPSGQIAVWIGSYMGSATFLNGSIRRFAYWPARLGNEVLQRITQ